MKENELIIYGARDTSTGKLVSDITNPRRKYWDRRGNALSAINNHNGRVIRGRARANHGTLELVTFRLVEDATDINVGDKCGWVSVKERLPAESSEYIYALRAYGSWIYGVVHYSAKHKLFNTRDTVPFEEALLTSIKPTFWMPLPEPPKMKGGEE